MTHFLTRAAQRRLQTSSSRADESTKLVTKWISDENFSKAIPNAPRITSGKVVAQSSGVPALV